MTGAEWIRSQSFGGPYLQKKLMYSKDEEAIAQNPLYKRQHSINYRYLRYARILLWRAECAVEEGDLETARQLVNRVRRRAANPVNITMGKVLNYEYPSGPSDAVVDWTQPAANYLIRISFFPSQNMLGSGPYGTSSRICNGSVFLIWYVGIDYEVLTEFIEKDSEFRYAMLMPFIPKRKYCWPLPQNPARCQPVYWNKIRYGNNINLECTSSTI